jgi:prepilin-type N-terminal cleavage/methylation domain-containing protein
MIRQGFSLLEVLIAIMLMAAVLPVALSGMSSSVQVTQQIRRHGQARHLAENHLAHLLATGAWQSSAQAGEFDAQLDGDESTAFRWQLEIIPWRDPNVRILRCTVTWDPPSPTHAVTMETLAVPPATSTSGTTGGSTP